MNKKNPTKQQQQKNPMLELDHLEIYSLILAFWEGFV